MRMFKKQSQRIFYAVPCLVAVAAWVFMSQSRPSTHSNSIKQAKVSQQPSSSVPKLSSSKSESLNFSEKADKRNSRSFGELTATNVEGILEDLQKDEEIWREQRGEFYASWGEIEPLNAIAHARETGGSSSSAFISQSIKGWAGNDPEAARRWVLDQEDGREKMLFAKAVLSSMEDAEHDEKAQWVTALSESNHSTTLVKIFAGEWAENNPQDAINWVEGLSEQSVKIASMKSVVKTWATSDVDAAGEYLDEMSNSLFRDQAVSSFVSVISNIDKQAAVEWIDTIDDPQIKKSLSSFIY